MEKIKTIKGVSIRQYLILALLGILLSFSNDICAQEVKYKVFLLAGQSNMDGRANAADLPVEDLKRLEKVAGRIKFYYNHNPLTPLQVTDASEYIKNKFSLEKSFGPELFFGIKLAEEYPDQEFIFIKRSKGGTSLYGCWNPDWDEKKAAHMKEAEEPKLYFDFIKYIETVMDDYKTSEYEFSGVLWVQGETDSGTKKWGELPAEEYGKNLRNLISGLRSEMNSPDLPFVMFQVGGGKVVEAMKATAEQDSLVYLIPQSARKGSPDFYQKNPPPIGHYIASSMKRIGEEFFYIYKSIGK